MLLVKYIDTHNSILTEVIFIKFLYITYLISMPPPNILLNTSVFARDSPLLYLTVLFLCILP